MVKLLVVAFMAVHSSNALHPSIAGSNWHEVAKFDSMPACEKAREEIKYGNKGNIGGPSSGATIIGVCVPMRAKTDK
jgi:hypothetical protein